MFLIFEEPVEVRGLFGGTSGGKGDVRGNVGVFGDEAEDYVGSLAKVELVGSRWQGLGPDCHGGGFCG